MGSPEAPSEGPTVGATPYPGTAETADGAQVGAAGQPGDATPAVQKRSLRQRAAELKQRVEEAKRSAGVRSEDLQARHASARIAVAAYERDRRLAGGLLAGGLAFRLFLWLLPTALAIASTVRLIADASSESPAEVARHSGLGAALRATVAQAADASGRGAVWLLLLGIVLMLWAGAGMVKALRLLAGVAWQVRIGPLKRSVRASAVFSLVALVVFALPVLLGPLYAGGLGGDLVASLLSIAAFTTVTTWAMTVLPHPEGATWPRFIPGTLLIGLGGELLRLVTAVYFAPRLARTGDLYGALGLAAVFLTWLYLIGRLVVGGMNLNAELWRARQAGVPSDESGDETTRADM